MDFVTPWEFVVYGMTAGLTIGAAVYFITFYTGAIWRKFLDL